MASLPPRKSGSGSSELRRTGARVNLTLPPEVDRVLERFAAAAGTGKATIVREWLIGAAPMFDEMATALEAARKGQSNSLAMMSKALRGSINQGEQAELELGRVRAAMSRKSRK